MHWHKSHLKSFFSLLSEGRDTDFPTFFPTLIPSWAPVGVATADVASNSLTPVTAVPPSTSTFGPPAISSSPEPVFDSILGRIIFRYMSQCTGIEFDMDNCLVAKTVDSYMNMMGASLFDGLLPSTPTVRTNTLNERLQFIKPLDGPKTKCGPQEIPTEQSVRPLVDLARQQCSVGERFEVSDAEFEITLCRFLRILSRKDCWDSLCGDSFRLHFGHAAQCAGVRMNVHLCLLDHFFHLIPPLAMGWQESEPCIEPGNIDWSFFISFITNDATAQCGKMNIPIGASESAKMAADLTTLFAASKCWDTSYCDEEPGVSSADFSVQTPPNVMDRLCIYEAPTYGTYVELSFYYRLETKSTSNELLQESLEDVKRALFYVACNGNRDGRRAQALNRLLRDDTNIVAVKVAPKDTVLSECKHYRLHVLLF